MIGGLISLGTVAWISIGTQINIAKGTIRFPQKPVSVEGCSLHSAAFVNTTLIARTVEPMDDLPFFMYRISYMYYTLVGFLIALLLGLLVSYLTGGNDGKHLDKSLFSPVIHRFMKEPKKVGKNGMENNCVKVIDVKMNYIKQ